MSISQVHGIIIAAAEVVIGIVDDGLDWEHADLDNYYADNLDYDFCGNDGDPTPSYNDAHGTAAAGVAAAAGNNSIGVSGRHHLQAADYN